MFVFWFWHQFQWQLCSTCTQHTLYWTCTKSVHAFAITINAFKYRKKWLFCYFLCIYKKKKIVLFTPNVFIVHMNILLHSSFFFFKTNIGSFIVRHMLVVTTGWQDNLFCLIYSVQIQTMQQKKKLKELRTSARTFVLFVLLVILISK